MSSDMLLSVISRKAGNSVRPRVVKLPVFDDRLGHEIVNYGNAMREDSRVQALDAFLTVLGVKVDHQAFYFFVTFIHCLDP